MLCDETLAVELVGVRVGSGHLPHRSHPLILQSPLIPVCLLIARWWTVRICRILQPFPSSILKWPLPERKSEPRVPIGEASLLTLRRGSHLLSLGMACFAVIMAAHSCSCSAGTSHISLAGKAFRCQPQRAACCCFTGRLMYGGTMMLARSSCNAAVLRPLLGARMPYAMTDPTTSNIQFKRLLLLLLLLCIPVALVRCAGKLC